MATEPTPECPASLEDEPCDTRVQLGLQCLRGEDTPKDVARAVQLFRAASDDGHADGHAQLGICFRKGLGVDRDAKEAVRLFRLSSAAGCNAGTVQLGLCYLDGLGVPKDWQEAARLFQLAAALAPPMARFSWACAIARAREWRRVFDRAVRLFRQAVARGNKDAHVELGKCYMGGSWCAR